MVVIMHHVFEFWPSDMRSSRILGILYIVGIHEVMRSTKMKLALGRFI